MFEFSLKLAVMFLQLVQPMFIKVFSMHPLGVFSYTYSRDVHCLSYIIHTEG